jgi:hypothetical protein
VAENDELHQAFQRLVDDARAVGEAFRAQVERNDLYQSAMKSISDAQRSLEEALRKLKGGKDTPGPAAS